MSSSGVRASEAIAAASASRVAGAVACDWPAMAAVAAAAWTAGPAIDAVSAGWVSVIRWKVGAFGGRDIGADHRRNGPHHHRHGYDHRQQYDHPLQNRRIEPDIIVVVLTHRFRLVLASRAGAVCQLPFFNFSATLAAK